METKRPVVFVIPDTHFPFHSREAFKKIAWLIHKLQPTHIVQLGDLLDQYIFSKYSRSLGITSAMDVEKGLAYAADMWETSLKLAPHAKCFQLLGNHDMRLAKRISERLPELEKFFSHKNLYTFKDVTVMGSDRDHLEIDGVVYVHGWMSKSLDHAKHFNKPTVHGHRHRPAIEYHGPDLWAMDCGFVADETTLPMQYTMNRLTRWAMCCGVVDAGVPRLIPL